METIGFLELNSIAKGIEAADIVLKTAAVELIFSRAGCPGKYYLLFTGDVAAVQASIEAGCAAGGDHVVDHCVIPSVHPQVIRAINMTNMPEEFRAVGVMEYFSVTASVYSADAAVKAADVDLVDVRLGTGIGGKSFVVLTGEVAAVREAVSCGIHTPAAEGMLVSSVVIPNPHRDLLSSLM
ncbi:MAG: BMC domain-containing protein [Clostridiales bacterium]|nr:BMC domain-containing protein [Clostridiales bacterium]MDY4180172.1 BMC domain-containing protein [Pseudoflavonifractor sp.]